MQILERNFLPADFVVEVHLENCPFSRSDAVPLSSTETEGGRKPQVLEIFWRGRWVASKGGTKGQDQGRVKTSQHQEMIPIGSVSVKLSVRW